MPYFSLKCMKCDLMLNIWYHINDVIFMKYYFQYLVNDPRKVGVIGAMMKTTLRDGIFYRKK